MPPATRRCSSPRAPATRPPSTCCWTRRPNVDLRNRFGDTPLMAAVLHGHVDVAKKLRARGAAVNGPGWTPLIYAATGGHEDLVRWLLAEGAAIDATSPNGTTALMMAAREGRYKVRDPADRPRRQRHPSQRRRSDGAVFRAGHGGQRTGGAPAQGGRPRLGAQSRGGSPGCSSRSAPARRRRSTARRAWPRRSATAAGPGTLPASRRAPSKRACQ